ncbi:MULTISPECIES: hypothetical protein [unclassified Rhodococcus (in: high G+C Gram-positive bacteria)]|uniref:hypothetical protein n=1 Tax=unclassified Rhodococcus (in: high G+C Gram-positive bacteria) TaxID=192944 RepID=UPI00117B4931|nr:MULTISPECIES: hypothetical protein [unclassified Rhodococcus (in: high G+C Gram-positive bacteria)]
MTNELERWGNLTSNVVPSRDERNHRKSLAKVVQEARLAGLKVDAESALTARIMERAVDIDAYRKQLANGDPVLDAVLTRIEIGFVDKAGRIQRNFGSEFPS